MKKVGIITSVICAVAVIAGTWYFMQRIQKSEQENEILQQIVQELDEKLKQEQAKPHLENEELWQKVQELEKKLTLAQEKLKKETFVNPLFYEKLEAVSTNARDTYLTPNSLVFSNSPSVDNDKKYKNGWTHEACKLLENEQDSIGMKCILVHPDFKNPAVELYRFIIKPCNDKNDNYLKCSYKIEERSYDNSLSDDYYSSETLVIEKTAN